MPSGLLFLWGVAILFAVLAGSAYYSAWPSGRWTYLGFTAFFPPGVLALVLTWRSSGYLLAIPLTAIFLSFGVIATSIRWLQRLESLRRPNQLYEEHPEMHRVRQPGRFFWLIHRIIHLWDDGDRE